MTRLFVRLYLGVLIVLFLAWYIHGVVLANRSDAEWRRVVEEAHAGGARLVASQLAAVPPAERSQKLEQLRQRFDYPLEIIAREELPASMQRRLAGGEDLASDRAARIVAVDLEGTAAVRLGPFPNYNLKEIEESLGGWMRLTAEQLNQCPPTQQDAVLLDLQAGFEIPLNVVPRAELPTGPRQRLNQGDDIVFYQQEQATPLQWLAATPLADGVLAVSFGPFPSFERVEQTAATTTLALVLIPAALAIAVLLRPIARQLRLVERTSLEIAAGNFSARVDERKVYSVRPLAEAFNNMAGHVETMLRTQRELLQAVSHELRTPLSRIIFAIDLIRDAPNDSQREERLRALELASQELDELVGELLRYVRLESGQPALELVEVDLAAALSAQIEKQALMRPAIEFRLEGELRDGRIVARADGPSLERVFGNLLANAGRFAQSQVVMTATSSPEGLVVDVDDDGPGIPAADRGRVFDPFVRLDESSRGAGLGLALVRRILTHHGGRVLALESPLGGCRIRTIWPSR